MGDHDAHDPDDLDPDEPRTPWWMPLLGGSLFLLAGLYAVVTMGETDRPLDGIQAEDLPAEAAPPGQAPRQAPDQAGRDHAGHDHAGHDHAGHDH